MNRRIQAQEAPSVSVIIPCRNEEEFIERCLDSIIGNDYPKDRLEVIVIDGLSEDRTREILREYTSRHPFIKVLDNPSREVQLALNVGIEASQGQIVMRADAHSMYKSNYISECVRALREYSADNVGGRWVTVPRSNSLFARAICHAMSTSFGVGNAYYRLRKLFLDAPVLSEPRWEIHVAYFCCRKEVFHRIGLFNELLDRSEDVDFRARLKRAGFRTLFVPTIECYYSMRTKYLDFVKHMFRNGLWVLLPLNRATGLPFSMRHIVPLLFTLSLLLTGILAIHSVVAIWLFAVIVTAYSAASLFCSTAIAIRERDSRLICLLPVIFLSLHLSYGLGSVVGAFLVIKRRLAQLARKLRPERVNLTTGAAGQPHSDAQAPGRRLQSRDRCDDV